MHGGDTVLPKMFLGITLLQIFLPVVFAQGGSLVVVEYYKNYEVGGNIYPVQLVYTPNDGYVALRIRFEKEGWSDARALEFLKKEVLHLAWADQLTPSHGPAVTIIGEYTFVFAGGFPTWIPHRVYDFCKCQYLQFGIEGKVTGKVITAKGVEKIPLKFYPYLQ
jgi:hypothetical protein